MGKCEYRKFAKKGKSKGLCLIFDISGFTRFSNIPNVNSYLVDYINHVIECVEVNIYGGEDYWNNGDHKTTALQHFPSLSKFLGDGMLYIWEEESNDSFLSTPKFKVELLNRLWNLQKNFVKINEKLCRDINMPVSDLPPLIKFGIAQGDLDTLEDNNGNLDFIGACINLASRLVKYCPKINFIASSTLDLPLETLSHLGYFRIIATSLRNFENQIVIIDTQDYQGLLKKERKRLFKELD